MRLPKPSFSSKYQLRSIEALQVALQTAPAYHSWRRFDLGEHASINARYAALPVLTKQALRDNFPQGLVPNQGDVAAGLQNGEIEYVQTSGTTQERVTNIWNQAWWDASEHASWQLNAHTAHLDGTQPEAVLVSALNVGILSPTDLPMKDRIQGRLLFLNEKTSTREWTDRHYQRMAQELATYQPVVLEANPSFLAHLAWWALDHGISVFQPQVIVFTYEFISAVHLRAIRQVFQSPLISSYGATETGYVFMECEHGRLHQNTEFCRVDFQPLKSEHGGPQAGRLLVSTFQNPWTALLRFDAGDLARLDEAPSCPCGRTEGYRLLAIEGRLANATFTTNGRLVSTQAADAALAEISGIRDYQLVQNSSRDYTLRLVVNGSAQATADESCQRLCEVYGAEADIQTELQAFIEPAISGKYRRTHAAFVFNEEGLFA